MFWKQKRPKQPDPGTPLTGTRQERIMQLLRMAGWYEGREVDISIIERFYREQRVELTEGAKAFFRKYSGLAERWHIKDLLECFQFEPFGPQCGDSPRCWMFQDEEYGVFSLEFNNVSRTAGEPFTMVGHIGYYYPARVWIGASGKIYVTHEYDEKVHVFDTLLQLIDRELTGSELNFAYTCREPQQEIKAVPPAKCPFPRNQPDEHMCLEQRVELIGTAEERLRQVLHMAGWYEERQVDISVVEEYYRTQGVPLFDAAKAFFREYDGLAGNWVLEGVWGATCPEQRTAEFCFHFFPRGALGELHSLIERGDCRTLEIRHKAGEPVLPLGEIGYRWYTEVWMGESGRVYTAPGGPVRSYQNFFQLLAEELRSPRPDYATIYL